jgi:adenosine deaminase
LSFDDQYAVILSCQREYAGLDWRLFVTVKRGHIAAKWDQALEFFSLARGALVVGLDISRSYRVTSARDPSAMIAELPENAISVTRQVRDLGGQIAFHAGWYDGSDQVWEAIDDLGATRLGHGVAAATDRSLLQRLRRDRTLIEICPTAAARAGHIALPEHPGRRWIADGMRVSLGSDHPIELDTDIFRESKILHTAWPELEAGHFSDGAA